MPSITSDQAELENIAAVIVEDALNFNSHELRLKCVVFKFSNLESSGSHQANNV